MANLRIDLTAQYQETNLTPPSGGAILHEINQVLAMSEAGSDDMAGYRATVATSTNLDVNALTGARGETVSMQSLHTVILVVRRTATVISGTFAFASTPLGITTGTKTVSSTPYTDQVPIGGPLYVLMIAGPISAQQISSTDLAITLGTPVGFVVDVLITGHETD